MVGETAGLRPLGQALSGPILTVPSHPGASEAARLRPPGSLPENRVASYLHQGRAQVWGSGEDAWDQNPRHQDRGLEKPGGGSYLGIKGVLGAGLRETGAGRAGTGGA